MSAFAAIAASLLLAGAPPALADQRAPVPPDQQEAIEEAFAAAEALQGPLDGLWRLQEAATGHVMFIFVFTDPGGSPAPLSAMPSKPGVEGVWSDPDRPGLRGGSGFIDSVRHDGRWMQIRFVEGTDRHSDVVTLKADGKGPWTGEFTGGADAPLRVIMNRF